MVNAVAAGQASGHLVPLLYEVAGNRDLPEQARDADGRMDWRLRARHRLHEAEAPVDRASMPRSSRCLSRAGRRGTG